MNPTPMNPTEVVSTAAAPAAIGPYSQAIRANGMLFCSGQVALDPTTKQVVAGGVEPQTRQVLKNLEAVLVAGGASFAHVVKTTIFLADMDDFQAVNAIYAECFTSHPPARATVQVSRLPLDVRVEIDAIAVID
jgi:2-iminobutanoate/2-iminopropanoate deaminase